MLLSLFETGKLTFEQMMEFRSRTSSLPQNEPAAGGDRGKAEPRPGNKPGNKKAAAKLDQSKYKATHKDTPGENDCGALASAAVQSFLAERLDLARPESEYVVYSDVYALWLRWRTYNVTMLGSAYNDRTALPAALKDRRHQRHGLTSEIVLGTALKENVPWPAIVSPSVPRVTIYHHKSGAL